MKPKCIQCNAKLAKYPKSDNLQGFSEPRFCSIHCGYLYGLERTVDMKWCYIHNQWSCPDCYNIINVRNNNA